MTWNDFKKAMLALVLWREGENQGREGMRAIGHVIANRVANGQGDWLDVIEAKWQFSSISAPGDATLVKWPRQNGNHGDAQAFETAMQIADLIMSGADPDITDGAHFYANLSVLKPDCNFIKDIVENPEHPKTVQIGAHSFFK